jgi:hypothetical protein
VEGGWEGEEVGQPRQVVGEGGQQQHLA